MENFTIENGYYVTIYYYKKQPQNSLKPALKQPSAILPPSFAGSNR
jgi:hypothetical protein